MNNFFFSTKKKLSKEKKNDLNTEKKHKKIHTQRVQNQINIIHRPFNEFSFALTRICLPPKMKKKTKYKPRGAIKIILLCS